MQGKVRIASLICIVAVVMILLALVTRFSYSAKVTIEGEAEESWVEDRELAVPEEPGGGNGDGGCVQE